jgi:hypothetical protein
MNKDLLLKELDILKTYFEEVIDGACDDDGADLETMQMLFNLKEYVEDAEKYIKKEDS